MSYHHPSIPPLTHPFPWTLHHSHTLTHTPAHTHRLLSDAVDESGVVELPSESAVLQLGTMVYQMSQMRYQQAEQQAGQQAGQEADAMALSAEAEAGGAADGMDTEN